MDKKNYKIGDPLYNIPHALVHCFTSPNVSDSNGEIANVVDSLNKIGNGLFAIANAMEKLVKQ